MAWRDYDDVGYRTPAPERPEVQSNKPLFDAAVESLNTAVSVGRALQGPSFVPEENHNPLDVTGFRGSKYEQHHLDRFLGSRSTPETFAIMRRIDEEEENNRILSSAGAPGVAAALVAGLTDPVGYLVPGAIAIKGLRSLSPGVRGAIEVGAGFAGQAALSEMGLQASQETRTWAESGQAIGSAAILGALLGPALARLAPSERALIEASLERDRRAMAAHVNQVAEEAPRMTPAAPPLVPESAAPPVPDGMVRMYHGGTPYEGGPRWFSSHLPYAEGYATKNGRTDAQVYYVDLPANHPIFDTDYPEQHVTKGFTVNAELDASVAQNMKPLGPGWGGGSVGAAASDTRRLELQGYGIDKVPVLGRLVERSSPTLNNLSAESITARRATADLAETPFRFQGDEAPTTGPAIDRIVRMETDRIKVALADNLDRLYSEYRYAGQNVSLPRLRDQFERATGSKADGYLSYSEFKTEVSRALMNKDQHDIPQVAQAAQQIRGQIFDPWHQRAIEAGLLSDGLPKGAESYFHRVWNKEIIKAQRPKFIERVTSYLKADQATKAGIKSRMSSLSADLKVAADRIAKAKSEGESIVARVWHDDLRSQLEKEIANWEGKSVSEAKAAIKAREKYRTEREARASAEGKTPPADRLTSADDAIDRAVNKILLSDRNLPDMELQGRASEIADRILGSPDGRLPYEMATGARQVGPGETARGSLAARRFAIPDHMIADFLETDVEKVVSDHLRAMVPDVLLHEKFGDVEMSDVFRKINAEYDGLIAGAKSEAQRVKLRKEQEGVIARLAGIRDRVRGVYGFNPNAVMQGAARAVGFAKNVNLLTSGGSFALTSLVDMAGSVFRYGLGTVMEDAWLPFMRSLTGGGDEWKQAARQYKAMGIGNELALATRSRAITDITDLYRPQSRVERGLQWAADKYMVANFLAPWTDWGKINASIVAGNEILRASKAVAAGKATKKQIAQLAESGIPDWLASRIWTEFSAEGAGEVVNGVHLPNTDRWKNRQARQAFEGAVGREADIAIITPGQEKALWMSDPVLSVFGQFKSFMAASTQRLLIANLQRADAQVLQGLIFSIGMGMVSYRLNAMAGGTPVSDRPQDWIKEGISRSGVLGWFEEGNAMASKMTRGGVDVYRLIGADKPLSRYASRSALDSILGPTAGKIGSVLQVSGAATSADWTQADTKALRRLIATQNLAYIRRLWDEVEAGFNSALNVPEKRERN